MSNKDQALNEFNAWMLGASESGLLQRPSSEVVEAVRVEARRLGLDVVCSVVAGSLSVDIKDLRSVMEKTGRPGPVTVIDPYPDQRSPSYHYDVMLMNFTKQFGDRLGVFVANRASSLFRKHKLEGHCISGVHACIDTSPSSVMDFVYARKYWTYGWVEGEYIFKRRFLGIPVFATKVTIGIAYE